jgi:hypothetical protein
MSFRLLPKLTWYLSLALCLALIYSSTTVATEEITQPLPNEANNSQVGDNKQVSAKSLAHLYELMLRESPLTGNDLDAFISNIAPISDLKDNPGLVGQILESTGWTETRLAYCSTKITLGFSSLMEHPLPQRANTPDFARPNPEEMALIRQRKKDIEKAYEKQANTINANKKAEPKKQKPKHKKLS